FSKPSSGPCSTSLVLIFCPEPAMEALGRGTPHRGNARQPAAARSPMRSGGCRMAPTLIRSRLANGTASPVLGQVMRSAPQRPGGPSPPPRANGNVYANGAHVHSTVAGKRSRRGEAQGTVVTSGQPGALMSVPTPIRSTSAPHLPGDPAKAVEQAPGQSQEGQGIMNHLPWLAAKRTTLLQLMAEWSQSQGVLDDLTGQLKRLGRDRGPDQGPSELETGLRQVIAMVSRDLLQQFEFLELKASTYENLRVAFHGAGEPAPVLPTPPSRPPEIAPFSPEALSMKQQLECSPSRQQSAPAFVGLRPVVPRLQLGSAKNGVDLEKAPATPCTPSALSTDESHCSPTPARLQELANNAGRLARSTSCAALIQERKVSVEASPLTKQRILHQAVEEVDEAASLNVARWAAVRCWAVLALRGPDPNAANAAHARAASPVMEQRLAVGRSASSPNPGSPAQQDARTPQAMAPIYQEAPSPMLCKAGALYASAATLPHASPGMQVTSPMPQPVHAGSPHMVHAAPTPAPAPPTLAAQGTRPRLGVARMVSPMGRAMSTSALHAQVRHFPGAAHAPVQTVPACAWK
ncbi:unnamed protein product, partial [Effrenium voratum]